MRLLITPHVDVVSVTTALQSYGDYHASGASHTARSRRRHLIVFGEYLSERLGPAASILDVTPEIVREYQESLILKGESAATVMVRMVVVRGIFKHLRHAFPSLPDPTAGIRRVVVKRIKPQCLTNDECTKLLAAAEKQPRNFRGLQIRAQLQLGIYSGARLSDMRTMTLGQLRLDKGLVLNILRKNSVEHDIALKDETVEVLKEYLPLRHRMLKKAIWRYDSLPEATRNAIPLFPSIFNLGKSRQAPHHWRVSEKAIWYRIATLGKDCGVKVHPHLLRHTFAHRFLAVTNNLRRVAEALGHGDMNSTMIYTQEGAEYTRRVINGGEF